MSSNETLAEALHGLVDDEQLFLGDVVAHGVTRGKKIHRQRRVGRIVGSTAALAAVATAGTFAIGSPSTAGSAASGGKDNPFVSELSSQLKTLLPGVSYKVSAGHTKAGGADAILSDPLKTTLHIESGYYGTTHPPKGICGSNGALAPYGTCTMSTLPDGTWLAVVTDNGKFIDPKTGHPGGDFVRVEVAVNRADGTYVQAEQTAQNTGPQTADGLPKLPLTIAQMTAFVQKPAWTRIATPIPDSILGIFAAGMPTSEIASHLKPLLPNGLRTGDRGLNQDPTYETTPPGDYYTTIDDGQGKSLLHMSVQPTKGGFISAIDKPTCDGPGETDCKIIPQSDGSVLKVSKTASQSGSLSGLLTWGVTLFGKTTTVSITETNGPTVVGPADRTTMPLSTDQLTELVKNPVWTKSK